MIQPYYTDSHVTLYHGDCREVLGALPAESVDCCVTSPPYFGLRNYKCDGQIGLEQTPDAYIAEMVSVLREVRRTLKDDGTLWVNVGDSYARNGGTGNHGPNAVVGNTRKMIQKRNCKVPDCWGLKDKDLIGIPWMLAFALRADGWYLRGDHVWGKPNGMPESVTDRPTRSHEYVFLLSKSQRYFYNSEAVRTAPKASTITRLKQDVENQIGSVRGNGGGKTNGTMKAVARRSDKQRGHSRRHDGFNDHWDQMERDEQMADGANLRSIWWIPPAQCRESHFAVMPARVAQICILAGCRAGGVVLDPFNGSGTTGQVSRENGCKYIGVELNKDYCDLTVDRLRQGVLFAPEGDAA